MKSEDLYHMAAVIMLMLACLIGINLGSVMSSPARTISDVAEIVLPNTVDERGEVWNSRYVLCVRFDV